MSLLGIIETLRRNLKAVVAGCWVVLALVVVADVARVMTAEKHEAAATSEHAAAPAGEHAVAATAAHEAQAAVVEAESAAREEAHGFWARTYHIAENVPVFWTLFGFLGCVVIVVVCKTYGYLGVSEREDYYGE
jgi:hypothetical protein